MSHLHIPDGILPLWLWAAGLILAAAAVGVSLFALRNTDLRRKVPLLGMMSAMMLVGMTLEIVPIAYHVNLSVVAGIILGPWLAIIASLIANVLMALVGHGGITVVGLNTLNLGFEGAFGWLLFRLFRRALSPGPAAGVATAITLFLSTCLMLAVVYLANVDFSAGWAEHMRELMESPTVEGVGKALKLKEGFNLKFFAVGAFTLGMLGWLIEAMVTYVAVRFIGRVRPEILK